MYKSNTAGDPGKRFNGTGSRGWQEESGTPGSYKTIWTVWPSGRGFTRPNPRVWSAPKAAGLARGLSDSPNSRRPSSFVSSRDPLHIYLCLSFPVARLTRKDRKDSPRDGSWPHTPTALTRSCTLTITLAHQALMYGDSVGSSEFALDRLVASPRCEAIPRVSFPLNTS